MNELKRMNCHESIEMEELKRMNCHESIEMEGIEMKELT